MRNWNTVGTWWSPWSGLASRLPMRNWNRCYGFAVLKTCASRLPMRNWNRCYGFAVLKTCGFQTTYEELKHLIGTKIKRLMEASRLPMRNWNGRETGKQKTDTQYRFQTTYEELKPSNATVAFGNASLPDYLWGIETTPSSICFRLISPLPDYLWGIETRVHWVRSALSRRFQTTYEELKLYNGIAYLVVPH